MEKNNPDKKTLIEKKKPMTPNSNKKILGTGLDALLGPYTNNNLDLNSIIEIHISKIEPSFHQPRTIFNQEELKQLALSLKEHGLIQPIVVRKKPSSNIFILIAGERRLRAAQLLKWKTISAIIKDINDDKTYAVAIVENIQRSNLSPLEEAFAYQKLMQQANYTQEELAKIMGKSRSYLANTLRLINLTIKCQEYLNSKIITYGHARALLMFDNKHMDKMLDYITKHQLNVRQTENLAAQVLASLKEGISFQDTIINLSTTKKKSNSSFNTTAKKIGTSSKTESNNDTLNIFNKEHKNSNALPEEWQNIINSHKQSEDVLQIENNLKESLNLDNKIFVKDDKGILMINFDNFDSLDRIIYLLSKYRKDT